MMIADGRLRGAMAGLGLILAAAGAVRASDTEDRPAAEPPQAPVSAVDTPSAALAAPGEPLDLARFRSLPDPASGFGVLPPMLPRTRPHEAPALASVPASAPQPAVAAAPVAPAAVASVAPARLESPPAPATAPQGAAAPPPLPTAPQTVAALPSPVPVNASATPVPVNTSATPVPASASATPVPASASATPVPAIAPAAVVAGVRPGSAWNLPPTTAVARAGFAPAHGAIAAAAPLTAAAPIGLAAPVVGPVAPVPEPPARVRLAAVDPGMRLPEGPRTADPLGRVTVWGTTPWNCVPDELKAVLVDVSERFGEVKVFSTYRAPGQNRRAGGADDSYHLKCRAVDFRVIGVSNRVVIEYLKGRPEVGGYNVYFSGIIHIDDGPRRTW